MSFARSFRLFARSTTSRAHQACHKQQQRSIAPLMSRTINTAAASRSVGSGNLSSMAYYFKQQRHLPYFLEYLMWVVFGSEALHLIWLKMESKEYKEKAQYKIKLLEEIVDRIEKGQPFTDDLREEIRVVLMNGRLPHQADDDVDDDYLDKLLALSEQQEQAQMQNPASPSASSAASETPIPHSPWPTRETHAQDGGQKKKAFFL